MQLRWDWNIQINVYGHEYILFLYNPIKISRQQIAFVKQTHDTNYTADGTSAI